MRKVDFRLREAEGSATERVKYFSAVQIEDLSGVERAFKAIILGLFLMEQGFRFVGNYGLVSGRG